MAGCQHGPDHLRRYGQSGVRSRENSTLYGIIRPKYAGSYLRRGTPDGHWQTMPTPLDNATIETGMTVDGGIGAVYVTTQVAPVGDWQSRNPNTANVTDVTWDLVHDFGPDAGSACWLRVGANGLAIYANICPLTPLAWGRRYRRQPGAPPLTGRWAVVGAAGDTIVSRADRRPQTNKTRGCEASRPNNRLDS